MGEKTIFFRFLKAGLFLILYLSLILILSGCKKKTEQAVNQEQTKEVANKEQKEESVDEEQSNQLVFELDEVSVFDLDEETARDFLRGQSAFCDSHPNTMAKYPKLKSEKPLYGQVHFEGITPKPKAPFVHHFALDESSGTGSGYDLLYIDLNYDSDLTNDTPLTSLQNPPKGAILGYSSTEQEVCFKSFQQTFDFGNAGKRAIEIMPRLRIHTGGHSELGFIATTVRKGEIDINGAKYDVVLGYNYTIGKQLNDKNTAFHLYKKSEPEDAMSWWGADRLNSTHAFGAKYYSFDTTPTGDKLFAQLYKGPLGTFEVGAGGRNIQETSIRGSLRSKNTAVAVGNGIERGWTKSTKRCSLPVGDYLPAMMTVTFGQLHINISNNYHIDGKPRGKGFANSNYGIKIREDKPFVFDLSNKPEVMFASPAKNYRIKPGEELTVKAVLIDSELDIMIRRLYDMSRKQKREYVSPDGKKHTFEQNLSLDPKVIITRTNGEKVAEGVMPFG